MQEYREYKQDEIDLRDLLRVIVKRKWTIITIMAIIVSIVFFKTFTAVPIYEATIRLIIDRENPNVVSLPEVVTVDASADYYLTQYEIIKSRKVAREVIGQLQLKNSEEFFPKPKEGLIPDIKRSWADTTSSWKNAIVELTSSGDQSGPETPEAYEPISDLVSQFIDRIEVNPIRSSRLVDVSFRAKSPAMAAKIANTLANVYVSQNLEIKLEAAKDAVDWLHHQIEAERKKVEETEQAVLRYKEENNIITDFSSDNEKITAQKLAQLNTNVVDAESERVEAETRYQQAMALEGNPEMLDSIPEVLNNELIRQIKAMEVDLYKKMSELSKKYGQNHPRMKAIDSELQMVQKRKAQEVNRVINSLKSEYKVALAREQSLKGALARQKLESLELNQKAIQYGVLKREAESAKHMYELLIKRFKETTLTEDMKTGNIRIIDRAEVPKTPVLPRKRLNIILAFLLSLMMGTFLAFILEFFDNTIKIPEDIKNHLDIPFLGAIPTIEKDKHSDNHFQPDLVMMQMPKSIASEAYRGIRTNILFSLLKDEQKVILVSSAGPGEGKTVTVINLAITMAHAGNKVIILDCDMRRPTVHKRFGFSQHRGISDILVSRAKIRDALMKTEIPNLHILPSGTIPPNPSEILSSPGMTQLMSALRGHYQYILIDSPPLMAATDAAVLVQFSDGVILVIRAGEMQKGVIQNGLNILRSVNANALGAVLNDVDMDEKSYYYYPYYYAYDDMKDRKNTSRSKM